MKYKLTLLAVFSGVLFFACKNEPGKNSADTETIAKVEIPIPSTEGTDGVRMIPVETPAGTYKVWTRKVGNNPKVKVLLLHGGPAMTTEYMECFGDFLPREGYEMYYYHQLGSYLSDQPSNDDLWVIDRFVEEVEQVRQALGLDKDNFYLLGHSWGGILAIEYALKYQQHLKGLVISNMMSSAPDYARYAEEVLAPQIPRSVLDTIRMLEAKGDFANPKYMELLLPHFYNQHICRLPLAEWPDPMQRSFNKINQTIYVTMQGPSEFGISGKLEKWDRKADLPKIQVPTLVIGATHDTMDPKHMEWMASQFPKGKFLLCPNGSHMSMWDDQEHYFPGLIQFLKS